jgi:hypothetical protein
MTESLSRYTGYKTTHSNKVMEHAFFPGLATVMLSSTAFARKDVRFIILDLIFLFDKLFKRWLYIDDHFHVIVLNLTGMYVYIAIKQLRRAE